MFRLRPENASLKCQNPGGGGQSKITNCDEDTMAVKINIGTFPGGACSPLPAAIANQSLLFYQVLPSWHAGIQDQHELFANAALLQLGVNDTNKIRVEKIK